MTLLMPSRHSLVHVQSVAIKSRQFHCFRLVCSVGKRGFGVSETRPNPCFLRLSARSFSTSPPSSTLQQNDEKEPIKWLYKKTPNQMMKPRAILGVASFHTLYWTWYVVDFIPKVNLSPLEHLHIDPVVGYVGLFFSIFVNLGAAFYPTSLISGIGLQGTELVVVTHSMLTMKPASKGTVYEIGQVSMDPSTQETKKIVETLNGDFSSYRGFVALKANRRRLPYLLQIQDSNEVKDSWTLLQVLVNPNLAKKEIEHNSIDGDDGGANQKQSRRRGKAARGGKRGRRT